VVKQAGVEEIRGLSSSLGNELAEHQDAGLEGELDEVLT
jgi:hypothetical protein